MPREHGKKLRAERRIFRQKIEHVAPRHSPEHAAERIDDAVDRFVRNALALVTTARENDGSEVDGARGERAHERSFSDARFAVHVHGDRVTFAARVPCFFDLFQFALASDERTVESGRRDGSRRLRHAESREHLLIARALVRRGLQQINA